MKENKLSAVNPVVLLFLGACPAMASTVSVTAALGMGLAVLLIMLLSALVLGALKNVISENVALPASVLVIAAITSAVHMLLQAFLPSAAAMLGMYAAAAAVSLFVYRSAENARRLSLGEALKTALLDGITFIAALLIMAAVREFFGGASFAGISVGFMKNFTCAVLLQPAGGFLVFGILLAVIAKVRPSDCGMSGTACSAAGVDSQEA